MKLLLSVFLLACLPAFLSACSASYLYDNSHINEAQVTDTTSAGRILAALPDPEKQLPVVVYDFQDQTGQFKSNEAYADYSSAVTKGGMSVLIKSLLDTGNGKWFLVGERGGLDNLLKERNIINTMRESYVAENGKKLPTLPPLIYGGMILEGGIVFYDSNVLTGGAAAGYFGISGSTQYRRDIISVYLRAVDISSGQIILSVNSSKTVFSYGVNAGLVRYLAFDKLLETEAGFTVNEPTQLAVRQAIETSVYSLIMEGALKQMWSFSNEAEGKKAISEYLQRRDGKRSGDALKYFSPIPAEDEKIIPQTNKQVNSTSSNSNEAPVRKPFPRSPK